MIQIAVNPEEIRACFAVMHQLRTHLVLDAFVEQVQRQQAHGYHLAFLLGAIGPVAVAGYRYGLNLAWGRFLYVDDLVTDSEHRGQGAGQKMLAWLLEQARHAECDQLHLDSGLQRLDAHRFYLREGMHKTSFHFKMDVY